MNTRSKPFWRKAWGKLLFWRFKHFQRRRYDSLVVEHVRSKPILVLPQVLNPVLLRTGSFFAEALQPPVIQPHFEVLDLGTGSGVCAVFAGQHARRVVATDINPEAVRCAKINVQLHHLEPKIEVREGNLFAPVQGEQFDVVLFNPPFYEGTPTTWLDHAWRSENVAMRFAAGLRAHLRPDGFALLLLSSDGDENLFLRPLREQGFAIHIFLRQDFINEVLTIYKLSCGLGTALDLK